MDVSVKYYNENERVLFQSYPNSAQLNALTANNVSVSKDELLAYMMFTEQRNRPGFRTYSELQARIQQRLGDIDDYLTFNNGSVQTRFIGNDMPADFTERLGVGLGLSVVNKIESLTQADWELIPTVAGPGGHPTFDYQIAVASTGSNFIQAENKGCLIADNGTKPPAVSNHYASIKVKKEYLRNQDAANNVTLYSNLYYGTIGVLDNQNSSTARVWLVDPKAIVLDMDPYKYKLVTRLKYYLEELTNIGVRKYILKALRDRIEEIEKTVEFYRFNNVPIDVKNPKFIQMFMEREMFASVDTNEAFGKIFTIEKDNVLYPYLIAYPKALMKLMVNQNFDEILKYNYNPDFINDSVQVQMWVWPADYQKIKLPDTKYVFDERRKVYSATYFGKISHDKSGRIFGLLNEPQQLK